MATGDPGTARLYDDRRYIRGPLTLHAPRPTMGEERVLAVLQSWAARYWGASADTARFIALAQRVSDVAPDGFFHDWLCTSAVPQPPEEEA